MRIIAGDYKGRRLESPLDNKVRPTSDKVKEAMFSIIGNYIEDAVVCDLFAGSGSLGLEALSRGARMCYFVDESRESLKLVKENVKKCKAEEYSFILSGDFKRAMGRIREKVDVFLIDPPYNMGLEREAILEIGVRDILNDSGIILVEHHKDTKLDEKIGNFQKIKERKYGSICVSIFEMIYQKN